jgi:hypothetical protein
MIKCYTILSQVKNSQPFSSDQIFTFQTLDTTSGFLQTLGVLILTLVLSEALCLLVLQLVSRITWNSFYADFPPFQLFMMEMTAEDEDGTKEQLPTINREEWCKVLITTTWRCDGKAHCKSCDDEGGELQTQRCAICLCDYGELTPNNNATLFHF